MLIILLFFTFVVVGEKIRQMYLSPTPNDLFLRKNDADGIVLIGNASIGSRVRIVECEKKLFFESHKPSNVFGKVYWHLEEATLVMVILPSIGGYSKCPQRWLRSTNFSDANQMDFDHWISKRRSGEYFTVALIFSSTKAVHCGWCVIQDTFSLKLPPRLSGISRYEEPSYSTGEYVSDGGDELKGDSEPSFGSRISSDSSGIFHFSDSP